MTNTGTAKEVDTRLAEIHTTITDLTRKLTSTMSTAHRTVGDCERGFGKKAKWCLTDEVTMVRLTEMVAAGQRKPFGVILDPAETLERINTYLAKIQALTEEINRLEAIFDAAPWSRFFIVTSSNGHIHSSRHCSTCNRSTEYGWLPNLSGMTEQDAVAAHGPLLCTVCFPDAPVEHTSGRKVTSNGSCTGTLAPSSTPTWRGEYRYGTCTCGKTVKIKHDNSPYKHRA